MGHIGAILKPAGGTIVGIGLIQLTGVSGFAPHNVVSGLATVAVGAASYGLGVLADKLEDLGHIKKPA